MAKPPDLVGLNSAYGRYDTLTAEQKAEHGTGVVYQTLDEIMVEIRNLMANKNTRGQANTLISQAKQQIQAAMNKVKGVARERAKDRPPEPKAEPTSSWSEGRGWGRASADEPLENPMGRRQADDGTSIGDGSGLFGGERLTVDDSKEDDPFRW